MTIPNLLDGIHCQGAQVADGVIVGGVPTKCSAHAPTLVNAGLHRTPDLDTEGPKYWGTVVCVK
ncbi:hypothetical protein LBMAG15_05070 [Actinomycetes bacterium]|nr:hypothetical protein LBMAG15_05070 [Actinomycetes bacterium]